MTGSFYLYLPALLTLVLHLPTLSNNLVWDDRAAVPMNPDATGQRPLMSLFTHDFWGQDITLDDSHKSYRPLATLTYRLNHNLHGLNPLGYHLVNVLTHTLVTYLFSRFSAQVTQPAAALIAALLFAVHPIHAEPVSCIVGRSDLLCALFVLVGLLSHLSSMDLSSIDLSSKAANPATNPSIRPATKYSAFIIAILSGFIATFCKELGVTVYGLYFAHEIIVAITQSPLPLLPALASHFTSPSTLPRLLLTLLSPFLITSLHLYLHKSASLYTWSILENSISLLPSRTARALSYAHTHTLYMLKLFLPTSLCYDYGYPCIPHITSPLDYRNVFSLTMYAAVVYFGVHAAVNKNAPRLWAGALLVVPFIPASNLFFPVGTVLGERLLYMPSMGFCLGVGVVLNETFPSALRAFSLCAPPTPPTPTPTPTPSPSKKKSPKKKCSRKFPVSPFALSILSLLLLLSLKSVHRCQEWRSEITLFESALKVCPTSLKVLNNLALMLLDKKTAPRAGELLDTAIAIHADYPSALFNRGLVSYVLSDWGDAIQFFELSLKSDSYQPKAWAYLSQTKLTVAFELQKEGRWEEAKVMLGEALIQSDNAIAQGCTLPLAFHVRCQVGHELELGEESLWYCSRAIEINAEKRRNGDPLNEFIMEENSHNAMALIFRSLDKMQEAVHHYELGLDVNPDCFEILVNMGGLLTDMGMQKEAMEYYGRALEKEPDSPELMTNIGWLLELQGYLGDARDHYKLALELLHPYSHPQIVNNLNNVQSRIQTEAARQEEQQQQQEIEITLN